jgi:hypothetical protein
MTTKPASISKEDIERKYHEGHWEQRLPQLELIAKEIEYAENSSAPAELTHRRTETYKQNGHKVLQRCLITRREETIINLTYLAENGVGYFVKRNE